MWSTLLLLALSCASGPPTVQAMPGAAPRPAPVEQRLREAAERRADEPAVRPHHLDDEGEPRFVNRLVLESSPYLLQHAHNPVDWYPWGDEAFERARAEGKPVFLSIGYSTCHWCHVMERESFEDVEIAALLNEHFVAVKVDREERPDVDEVYMAAVQAMTGRGGWPMTLVLTPEREPIFAGTYLPPADGERGAKVGLRTVLETLVEDWGDDRQRLVDEAAELSAHLRLRAKPQVSRGVPRLGAVHGLFTALRRGYDRDHGGFGRAPKFPRPAAPSFLLRYGLRTGDSAAITMVETMLARMAAGGIHDQLGGGFHRYSVDARWHVPHFEKMLYDNAQLAALYVEGWQVTGAPELAAVARSTLDALQREWTLPEGGLASATDADSPTPEGTLEEGRFFTWTPQELGEVLSADDTALAARVWGVTPDGDVDGRSVLVRAMPAVEAARSLDQPPDDLDDRLERVRTALLEARSQRPPPLRDDKVIAAWNGLAVGALARGGFALDEPSYVETAEAAASFLLEALRDDDGTLHRTWRHGEARHPGTLDDHAFLIAGLLDLHEATSDPRWLREALALQAQQDARFSAPDGAWFRTADDTEPLLTRSRPVVDSALPSGNAVAIDNVLRLAAWTGDQGWLERADRALAAVGGTLQRGSSAPGLAAALLHRLDGSRQVVIAHPDGADPEPLVAVLRRTATPHHVQLVGPPSTLRAHRELVPWLEGKEAVDAPTAYVCEAGLCQAPTADPATLAEQLARPPMELAL